MAEYFFTILNLSTKLSSQNNNSGRINSPLHEMRLNTGPIVRNFLLIRFRPSNGNSHRITRVTLSVTNSGVLPTSTAIAARVLLQSSRARLNLALWLAGRCRLRLRTGCSVSNARDLWAAPVVMVSWWWPVRRWWRWWWRRWRRPVGARWRRRWIVTSLFLVVWGTLQPLDETIWWKKGECDFFWI